MAVEYQVKYTPGFDPTIVNVSQNDVGRQFDIKIIDETGSAQQIPNGSTVKFVGMKPSGLGFTVNCTFNGAVVHVTTTDIMTDECGLMPAEVQITNGNTVIGTANVNLRVERNPHPDGTIDDNIEHIIPTFEAIYQRLDALEGSVSSLQTTVGQHTSSISSLSSRMTTAEGTLTNVENELDIVEGSISNIGTELGGIRTGYDGTVYQTAGDAVRGQVSDLHTDVSDITNRTDNRYNPSAITDNTYITADGTSYSSTSFFVTGYIPVTGGEDVYFWGKNTNNVYSNFNKRFICAYDSNKTPIPSAGSNSERSGNPWTVASGVSYLRITITKSNVSGWTELFCGNHAVGVNYEPYGVELKAQPQIDENTENIDNITRTSSNLFDTSQVIMNKWLTKSGDFNISDTYCVTDYIQVDEGQKIYSWGKNNGEYVNVLYRFICAFDSTKTPVPSAGTDSGITPPYTVPAGVKYVRFSVRMDAVNTYDNLYIGTHALGVDYEPYGRVLNIDVARPHVINDGDSILEAVKYCYENEISKLIVEAGTYNIIDEYEDFYGADYFTNYINYAQGNLFDAGVWLQNIEIKFSAGAKVLCKYQGENQNVKDYFCAFATGNNVIIDGLVLDAENLRYGIHADFNTGTDETYFIVKNSDLKNVRSDGNKCIGAGLGKHVYWLFENTIFRTTGSYYAMRIHNNVDSSAQSKIVVKDCYINGDGWFVFNAYSTSELQTIIQVCGCSYKVAPVVGRESPDSYDNFTLIAWNNELRS